jgi:putative sterol carrier protein
MASPTDAFFDELSRRGHEPAFGNRTATVRFDVARNKHTDHWTVAINKGDIAVSRADGPADCIIGADQQLFDALATGRTNPMAAMLRGSLLVEGDAELLVAARRLLPALAPSAPPAPTPAPESASATTKARKTS